MTTSTSTAALQPIMDLLQTCAHAVRRAIAAAEYRRAAEVVGLGADGFDTSYIDQVAEDAALALLAESPLALNVLSEETGLIDRGAALTVIVDPIDATNNAIATPNLSEPDTDDTSAPLALQQRGDHLFGFPYFAFSAGVLSDEGLIAGCVMNLPTGELFTAIRGDGVRLDGLPVGRGNTATLQDARVALIRPETAAAWRTLQPVAVGARRIRITGCSALDLALISTGILDAIVNPNRYSPRGYGEKIVDYAGGLALLQEAGGLLTHLDGSPVPLDLDLTLRTPLLGASTPALHADLLRTLHATEDWDRPEAWQRADRPARGATP